MVSFTKEEILDQIPVDNHRDLSVKYILEGINININKIRPDDLKCLRSVVSAFKTKRNEKYAASRRDSEIRNG